MGKIHADDKESKLIRSVFISSVLTLFAQNMAAYAGQIVDGAIISKFLGASSMAAFQLESPFNMFLTMLSQLFFIGVQGFCAQRLGAGKKDEATSAYTTSVFLLGGISIAIAVVTLLQAGPIGIALGASGTQAALLDDLKQYIIGFAFCIPAFCLGPVMVSVLFLEGKGRVVIRSLLLQSAVDVALDLVNVFVAHQGMFGMGLSTTFCYYIAIIYMAVARRKGAIAVRLEPSSFKLSVMKYVFRLGLPAGVDHAYKAVRTLVLNTVLASIAVSAAIAAYGSINILNCFFHAVTSGIGTAVLTMTAIFYGERDKRSIERLMKFALAVTLGVELAIAAISFIGAPLIMRLLTESGDTETLEISTVALRIFVLSLPLFGINFVNQKYYNSTGNRVLVYVLSALDNLIFICMFAAVLGKLFQYKGVFLAFAAAELCTLIVNIVFIIVKLKRLPRGFGDCLSLPGEFDIPDSMQYTASATTKEEVIAISGDVHRFCMENGMNDKDAMWFSLAVEELGMNFIRWGMSKKKKESMDIRLHKTDSWVLRIRDDCGSFDPTNWLSLHQDESAVKNIGIRMVLGGSKDVSYVSAMKTNTVIITYNRDGG